MDLVLPGESSARMRAVRRTSQILFLILSQILFLIAFEIYRASVLGLRAIGGGHSAPSKFFSFLGLTPINKNAWADHTKKIEGEAKLLLEKESRGVKECKFSN